MAANGISTLSTKQDRQIAKLELAKLKREGYTLNADGTILGGPDRTRTRHLVLAKHPLSQMSYWPKYGAPTVNRTRT